MFDLTGQECLLIFLAFFLGGVLKGILGIGLPLMVLSILGIFLSPTLVVALLVVPIVISNLWQAFRHGLPAGGTRRLLPMSLVFVLFTAFGATLLASIEETLLFVSLGVIVVGFSLLNLRGMRLLVPPHHEVWAGPCTGVVAGLLNGISTVNGPPLVMYLVGIQLSKDDFVKAYGLVALVGSIPLALSYIGVGIFGLQEFIISSMALLPVFLGMWAGQTVRNRIDTALFHKVLLLALIVLGANLIRRGLL
ncbi:sulfite exporter TauE/SafE family protein [Halomonas organivorans]